MSNQEIRDPIHNFIRLEPEEMRVLDCGPFHRLRHIHQLALTYLLYPSATHRRFEHFLGVMELASRVYDVVTDPDNVHHESVRSIIPKKFDLEYWRRTLRMAALCHDLGYLPFSHALQRAIFCLWAGTMSVSNSGIDSQRRNGADLGHDESEL